MIDPDKITTMKYALQNDIQRKIGASVHVEVQRRNTKRIPEIYIFNIISPNTMSQQAFEVYEDRKGNVYWNNFEGDVRQQPEKVVN